MHWPLNRTTGYNSFHQEHDRIFRVNYSFEYADGEKGETVLLDQKLSEVLKDKVPQVKGSTALRKARQTMMQFENHNLEEELLITEHDFFSMFSFKLIIGSKNEIFKNPDEVVITSSLADKLKALAACTRENLIGRPVFFSNSGNQPFVISGIMEDVPNNSSIQFDAIIPYKFEAKFSSSNNIFGNSSIFYEVGSGEDIDLTSRQVVQVVKEYYKGLVDQRRSQKILADSPHNFVPFTLPISETYLSNNVFPTYEESNSKTGLYIVSAIGLLILVVACCNFIMLSLGQSFKKVGEVGIRKAMGAGNTNIFSLFFIENLILSLLSLVLGSILCLVLMPVFNRLGQHEIYTSLIDVPKVVAFTVICVLLVVASTSIVPVIRLIKVRPNLMSSGKTGTGRRGSATNLFVTLQYGLSIFLIILTVFITRQNSYMKGMDLGFSSQNIINLRVNHLDDPERLAIRDQLKSCPAVVSLTLSDRNQVRGKSSDFIKNAQGENIDARVLRVDDQYIPTLGLILAEGKNFDESNLKEGDQSVIINETLASCLGIKDDAIGKVFLMWGNERRIIGVVKDFHFDSAKDKIEPLALSTSMGNNYSYIFIKYHPALLSQLIPFVKDTWEKMESGKELDFRFWDEQLEQRYQDEEKWGQIIGYAAIIAILISSLGLFGLTVLEVNRRVKEIGIRKVSGATVSEVMLMLNRDFVKWVAIAFVIAVPIAYYAMNKWLESFAYKTTLSWWTFALSGLLALGIALLTVSWQSWKAATRNPVEALRYE